MLYRIVPVSSDGLGLIDAVEIGQLIKVQSLLEHGANVNQRDQAGKTPLIIAD